MFAAIKVSLLTGFSLLCLSGCSDRAQFDQGVGNPDCELGTVGCPCRPDASCDEPLVCLGDACIALPEAQLPEPSVQEPAPSSDEEEDAADKKNKSSKSPKESGESSKEPSPEPQDPDPDAESEDQKDPKDPKEPDDPAGDEEPSPDPGQNPGKDPEAGKLPEPEEDTPNPGPPSCHDGQTNGLETDEDCGDFSCGPCALGQACKRPLDCESQRCYEGRCVQRHGDQSCGADIDCNRGRDRCSTGRCESGVCSYRPLPDGEHCNDENPCTAQDRCQAGVCKGKDTRLIRETFSGPGPYSFLADPVDAGAWEIGPAKASQCNNDRFGQDPPHDHSHDGGAGIMGADIGGCEHGGALEQRWCAWSDYVDLGWFEADATLSFWRHVGTPGFDDGPFRVDHVILYRLKDSPTAIRVERMWHYAQVDRAWTYHSISFPADRRAPVSVGICYRRLGGSGEFPGWSVDDVLLRQQGCREDYSSGLE